MNDLKYIILGIVAALIISLVLSRLLLMGGLMAGVVGFSLAGIIVGYLASGNTQEVAINGMMVGFVGGIIFILIGTVMNSIIYNSHANASMFSMFLAGGVMVGIIVGIIYGIISVIGGIIGSYIKTRT
jgi:CDP-diglyceride synthetase